MTDTETDEIDPRLELAGWANSHDEWIRFIVRLVVTSGRGLSNADVDAAYDLFEQEKQLAERTLPAEPAIALETDASAREAVLELTSLTDVVGVNALAPGAEIALDAGLTILFGENGTGKTGYARIIKALANSRTVEDILPDIRADGPITPPSATVRYRLGDEPGEEKWTGARGQSPFTRISVFDAPAVLFHVNQDLDYVYTPAALALFNHVSNAIQAVQSKLDASIASLRRTNTDLIERFDRGSSIRPTIETLGAATDIDALTSASELPEDVDGQLQGLQLEIGALKTNALGQQITAFQRSERVLGEALAFLGRLSAFPVERYNTAVAELGVRRADYQTFRTELFDQADLPADPDPTWEAFIGAGQAYRTHLESVDSHDDARCLYCRQALATDAMSLVGKYRHYLEDAIAQDIQSLVSEVGQLVTGLESPQLDEVGVLVAENVGQPSPRIDLLRSVLELVHQVSGDLQARRPGTPIQVATAKSLHAKIDEEAHRAAADLTKLRAQATNTEAALTEKQAAFRELDARRELHRSLPEIRRRVDDARQRDRRVTLSKRFPVIRRQVTDLAKEASDSLINQNFEQLFATECDALRAPQLRLEFVGREGRAQRRKVLAGNHQPSKVLSEGEQKVLAIADFLAEARLTGITAPIVFDDPVCSLDHRRTKEVANRVADLAQEHQVIVFTHDIMFTTTLLALLENTKRCTYYQVTDEAGKGHVARASGPKWDTVTALKAELNKSIQAAKAADGEVRTSLVRNGYSVLRSWCEVFVERELLAEVSQRYQPNVRMTALGNIKVAGLASAISAISEVFEEACRYTEAHSQPLPTLDISPTLNGLEEAWKRAQNCRAEYLKS